MIPNYLSVIWFAVAPLMANHLWQSTLFAAVAGLLTLALRNNHARARYGLWLAASVKFLVPFSLLVTFGGYMAWPSAGAGGRSGFYAAMQGVATVSDFLTVGFSTLQKPTVNLTTIDRGYHLSHLLPSFLGMVWLCGFAWVLFTWWRRWRRIARACRGAAPLQRGPEVEALRRMERAAGLRKRIAMLVSRASLEPGIFGIVRPVLVWPEGISAQLEDAQLEAILAHEVLHVRRRDNLAAMVHMLVEAIFWFHPLVWWLGARLVDERERACDEAVVELGNEPRVYAESVLKACEFCVASPLACVSGVTGAGLKKRIVRIVSGRPARKLDTHKKLLLAVAGFLAIAAPVGFGLAHGKAAQASATQSAASSQTEGAVTTLPKFEVASIKPDRSGSRMMRFMMSPGRLNAEGVPVRMLINFAYNLKSNDQLQGAPNWVDSEKFDIDAKEEDSFVQKLRKMPFDQGDEQVRLTVQSLLADRFNLKVSRTTKQLPLYALVVAKNGPKMTESKLGPIGPLGSNPPGPHSLHGMRMMGPGNLAATGAPIGLLVDVLSRQRDLGGRVVVDETGLKGTYDFTLKWTPEMERGPMAGGPGPGIEAAAGGPGGSPPPPDSSGPSIFTALQQQLGLRLKPAKGPVEVLVIDHIEPPSPD